MTEPTGAERFEADQASTGRFEADQAGTGRFEAELFGARLRRLMHDTAQLAGPADSTTLLTRVHQAAEVEETRSFRQAEARHPVAVVVALVVLVAGVLTAVQTFRPSEPRTGRPAEQQTRLPARQPPGPAGVQASTVTVPSVLPGPPVPSVLPGPPVPSVLPGPPVRLRPVGGRS